MEQYNSGSGQPIIHIEDCGDSSGYIKLDVVIRNVIPYVVQKKLGDELQFIEVSVDAAQDTLIEIEKLMKNLNMNNKMFMNLFLTRCADLTAD